MVYVYLSLLVPLFILSVEGVLFLHLALVLKEAGHSSADGCLRTATKYLCACGGLLGCYAGSIAMAHVVCDPDRVIWMSIGVMASIALVLLTLDVVGAHKLIGYARALRRA